MKSNKPLYLVQQSQNAIILICMPYRIIEENLCLLLVCTHIQNYLDSDSSTHQLELPCFRCPMAYSGQAGSSVRSIGFSKHHLYLFTDFPSLQG